TGSCGLAEASGSAGGDAPESWNPKARAPLCLNAPAVRSYLPLTRKRTELALAGRSKAQIFEALSAAVNRKELPTPEPGAMCFMMSKTGHLNDHDGHWRPHLMFFAPETTPAAWGAGLPGSPILAIARPEEHVTVFLVPVARWSDGTPGPPGDH